jgi:calcineurin-like phosphoesterase family protein
MPMGRLPEWVIGDTHWGHNNIIRYSRRPEDHDALMIANWKELVKPSDIVLHLGDVYFKNPALVEEADLPGQIYFLRGNHDKDAAIHALREIGWHLIAPFQYQIGKWRFVFTHWPLETLEANTINVHGHTHTLPDRGGYYINLSVERWNYAPQSLESVMRERIAILDNPERRDEYESMRRAEWDVVERRREREESLDL